MGDLKPSTPANARWRVLQKRDGQFEVYSSFGHLYGTYATRNQAEATRGSMQSRDDRAGRRTERPCMCCGNPFSSEGIHNRLCTSCRHRNSEGWDPHGVAPRSGRPR